MAELKSKQPDKKQTKDASPGEEKSDKLDETITVPLELSSLKDGVQIKVEGDYAEIRLSQYVAEHIGQFRACSFVICKFKHGQAPDITAIQEHGI